MDFSSSLDLDLLSDRENDITDVLEETFSMTDESFGERKQVDLKPDGQNIPLTNENKKEYVE